MQTRYAAPQSERQFLARSRCLFTADCGDFRILGETGALRTPNDHDGIFTRGGYSVSGLDVNDDAYTALPQQPAWTCRPVDVPGVAAPVQAFGLWMDTHDRLAFPVSIAPQPHRGTLHNMETGSAVSSGSCQFALTKDDASGWSMWLNSSGAGYQMSVSDGTTTALAELPSNIAVNGQHQIFDWHLDEYGRLHFVHTIPSKSLTVRASSSAVVTFPSVTGLSVRINSRTPTLNGATQWFRRLKIVAGNPSSVLLQAVR